MSDNHIPDNVASVSGPLAPASIPLESLPLRPELVGEKPYGAPQLDVPVRLNVNENPYPPSPKVRKQMADAVDLVARDINRYPDREATELRADLANYLGFGLDASNIWVANGSNEIMMHLLGAFGGPGRTVLSFTPTYSMYPEYARNTHTRYVTEPRATDYSLNVDDVIAAAKRHDADIIMIASPNNPTGTVTPIVTIAEICERFDGIVIIDEAYQEFTDVPDDSALALLPRYGKLVVSRTMSKAFAFAGGRLGYLAAASAVVDACRIVRLPYHLSAHSQAIARVALANSTEMLGRVVQLRRELHTTADWMREQGLEVIPSQANFCLFGRFADRHEVFEAFLERGVLIREVGPMGYLRVSAGTPSEMAEFRKALTEILPNVQRLRS